MVSTSVLHGHIGLTVSLEPCVNLCSFKRLNCSLKRDSNFTPRGSWTLYKEFSSFSIFIDFLNLYIDFAIEVYSIYQYSKEKIFLKLFNRDGRGFNIPADTDLKG